jgi:hypothetical protein
MTDERVVRSRLAMLPPIRRARLWRLYAEDRPSGRQESGAPGGTAGRARGGPALRAPEPGRFLDMWMDGGRAMLGAKGSGIGTAAKAAIDMGLARPMPSIWERRLSKELRTAYPGYSAARFFLDESRALAAAGRALGTASGAAPGAAARLFDPARRGPDALAGSAADARAAISLLRPFGELLGRGGADMKGEAGGAGAAGDEIAAAAMPLVPCPSALAPSILLFRDAAAAQAVLGDILPPLRLAAAHRALCELVRMPGWYAEELWRKVDRRLGRWFERLGPYLYPRAGSEGYGALFEAALSAGVLLSPDPELPSIVPGDFDDGELAALADALASM